MAPTELPRHQWGEMVHHIGGSESKGGTLGAPCSGSEGREDWGKVTYSYKSLLSASLRLGLVGQLTLGI
jgi:hypothetical protein